MAYWVQLELKGVGASTGACQLDLEQVTWIRFSREAGRIKAVEVHYKDGIIGFDGEQASAALQVWKGYLKDKAEGLRYTAPEGKAGVIELAGLPSARG